MPGRCQETGLADIGFFRGVGGLHQAFVDVGEFFRAFPDPAFQRLVGAGERFFRQNPFGDVCIGGHNAAVRHRTDADFEHRSA